MRRTYYCLYTANHTILIIRLKSNDIYTKWILKYDAFGDLTKVITQQIEINVLKMLNAKDILLPVHCKSYYFRY